MKSKILVLALAVATIAAIAFFNTNTAQASITATLHNLSPTGTGTIHATGTQQDAEICQWCHTPHSANTSFAGSAPLWNKESTAVTGQTFVPYGNTLAGTAVGVPTGSSLACLSCHDGVDAINSIVLNVDNGLNSGTTGSNVAFGAAAAGTAVVMPVGATDIGLTLTGVHPVSVAYTAGKASLYPTANVFGTGGTIAGVLDTTSKVQCSSCHDPHANIGDTTSVGTQPAGDYFLRMSNTGSALCLTCHGK